MEGLEKIIARINADSEKHCLAILENAAEEANAIRIKIAKETESLCKTIAEDAQAKCEKIEEISVSKSEQFQKQTALISKVNAINEIIGDTLTALDSLECKKYFDVLIILLRKNIQQGTCVMLLNQKDINRKPADFEARVKDIAAEAGASLSFGSTPANIPNGFLLQYGEIDINCSFPAIIDDMRDELKEIANFILFKEGE